MGSITVSRGAVWVRSRPVAHLSSVSKEAPNGPEAAGTRQRPCRRSSLAYKNATTQSKPMASKPRARFFWPYKRQKIANHARDRPGSLDLSTAGVDKSVEKIGVGGPSI